MKCEELLIRRCCLTLAFLVILVTVSLLPTRTQAKKSVHRPQPQSLTPTSRKIPVFRPLRRLIKNFIPLRKGSVTLVFQRSVMPRMRWFRQTALKNLPNAELPNMISIDGDHRYKIRIISSYDISAVTLFVTEIEAYSFPVKIVTCFSIDSAQFQYQLDTIIEDQTQNRTEVLDGILWTSIPESIIRFNNVGQLSVSCAARLESESLRFTDELNIYRSYLERNQLNGTIQVSSVGTGKIHKERDNYVEESGKYMYKGSREVIAVGSWMQPHVRYEVSFTVHNGSQDDVGVYTCAGERTKDRTYISSLVKVQQQQKPVLILLPCGDETVTYHPSHHPHQQQQQGRGGATGEGGGRTAHIRLVQNRPTCIRCRVFDYETAWSLEGTEDERAAIVLTKNGHHLPPTRDSLHLDWHLNVADGGLIELTLTFLGPSSADAGLYQCTARNSLGNDTATFRVDV